MHCLKTLALASAISFGSIASVSAQTPPPQYGAPLTLDAAKKAMAAAEAEANKNNWAVAIAIIDTTGSLVLFQKHDNTQIASVDIAIGKAKTALNFRRPSKALADILAAGGAGLRILALPGVLPLEGGVLIIDSGKIIGAVGVTGAMADQDAQVANAAAAAAK